MPLALEEKLRVVDWLLVSDTVLEAEVWPTVSLANESVVGVTVRGRLPVPVKVAICGESGALSAMESAPLSAPEIEGVKVTLTLQDAPGFRDDPQVLLSTAKFPLAAMELTASAAELVFLTVTAFEALVVPTTCGLNERLKGEGETMGALATVKGSARKAAQLAPLGKLSAQI